MEGSDGDGRGLFWRRWIAEATERVLYDGWCGGGGGRDGSFGGFWRDERIILTCD